MNAVGGFLSLPVGDYIGGRRGRGGFRDLEVILVFGILVHRRTIN